MTAMKWRWWLLSGPLGFCVGRLLGELGFEPWKVALGVGVTTGLAVGWFLWRERRWMHAQVDRVEQALKDDRL